MAKNLFNRYIWLLDTINSKESLSFEKINAHWRESPLNDDGKDLPIRTFHNHRSTIEEEFGLNIVCDRSTNEYYIINLSDLKGGNIKNWILESLAVHNVISEQIMLKDRIVMESIPSSYKYLAEIIESMKRNRILFIIIGLILPMKIMFLRLNLMPSNYLDKFGTLQLIMIILILLEFTH